MKKILIFLLLFLSISCGSNLISKKSVESIDCPSVFFASENRNYLDSQDKTLTLDNVSFKAQINNYAFNKLCFQENDILTFPLDILFIVDPIKPTSPNVILPLYVALLDSDQQLLEMQYFSIGGEMRNDLNTKAYLQTELSQSFNIITSKNNLVSSLVVGFMLDKNKYENFKTFFFSCLNKISYCSKNNY